MKSAGMAVAGWVFATLLPLGAAVNLKQVSQGAATSEHAPLTASQHLLVLLGQSGKDGPFAVEQLIDGAQQATNRAIKKVERRQAAIAGAYRSIDFCSTKGLSNEDCGECFRKATRKYKAVVRKQKRALRRGSKKLAATLKTGCYASAAWKEIHELDDEAAEVCQEKDFDKQAKALIKVKVPKAPRHSSCRAAQAAQKAARKEADRALQKAAQRQAVRVAAKVAQRAARREAQKVAVRIAEKRAVRLAKRRSKRTVRKVARSCERKFRGKLRRGMVRSFTKAFAMRFNRRRSRKMARKLARKVAPEYAQAYLKGLTTRVVGKIAKRNARRAARKVARRMARMVTRELPVKKLARTLARRVARKTTRHVHVPRKMVARAARMQVLKQGPVRAAQQRGQRHRFLQALALKTKWDLGGIVSGVVGAAKSVGAAAGKVAGAAVGAATGKTLGEIAGKAVGALAGSEVAKAVAGGIQKAASATGKFVVAAAKKALPVVLNVVTHPLFPVVMAVAVPGAGGIGAAVVQAAVGYARGKLIEAVAPVVVKAVAKTPLGQEVQKLYTRANQATGGKLGKIVEVAGPALAITMGAKYAVGAAGQMGVLAKISSKIPPKLTSSVQKVAAKTARIADKTQAVKAQALSKLVGDKSTMRSRAVRTYNIANAKLERKVDKLAKPFANATDKTINRGMKVFGTNQAAARANFNRAAAAVRRGTDDMQASIEKFQSAAEKINEMKQQNQKPVAPPRAQPMAPRAQPAARPAAPSRASSSPAKPQSSPSRAQSSPSRASSGPSRASSGPSRASSGPSRASSGPSRASSGPSRASSSPSRASSSPSKSSGSQAGGARRFYQETMAPESQAVDA